MVKNHFSPTIGKNCAKGTTIFVLNLILCQYFWGFITNSYKTRPLLKLLNTSNNTN